MSRARVAAAAAIALVAAACSNGGSVRFETRAATPAGGAGAAAVPAAVPAQQGGLLPVSPPATGATPGASAPGTKGTPNGATGRGQAGPAGPASEVVKIGTVLPLQGGQRDFGEPVLRTTQAFVDEVNARGGIGGRTLQLVAYSACLVCQDEALQAVRRLVEQDHVFAVVNTYVMVVAFQPVIPYLVQKGIPLIQGGAENQTSDALSPVNFATAPSGLFYGRFLAKMAGTFAHVTKVGIVHLSVPSETNGLPILKRELAREGVQVVDDEPIEAAEDAVANMDSVVIRMRARGADGVLATNPVLLIYGRLAAARQRWNVPWVGEAGWSHLAEDSCAAICDDLVLTDTAGLSFTDRPSPQMRQFVDTMARRYPGGKLTGHTLAAWVGMQLFAEVLGRLTQPDRSAFLRTVEALRNVDLGTTSPLTFSPDRHLGGTASTLLKFRNGHYIRVSDPMSFGEASP